MRLLIVILDLDIELFEKRYQTNNSLEIIYHNVLNISFVFSGMVLQLQNGSAVEGRYFQFNV